jgi:hypothetical protein
MREHKVLLQYNLDVDSCNTVVAVFTSSQPLLNKAFKASQRGIPHPFVHQQNNGPLHHQKAAVESVAGNLVSTGTNLLSLALAESELKKRHSLSTIGRTQNTRILF